MIWIDQYIFPEVLWTNKNSGNHTQYDFHITVDNLDDIIYFGEYSQPSGYMSKLCV